MKNNNRLNRKHIRKNKKTQKTRRKFFMLLFFLLICILLRNTYVNLYKNRVYTVKSSSDYEKSIDTNALVIKDEYIYSTRGKIKTDEENRISINTDIGTIEEYINNTGLDLNILHKEIDDSNDYLENFNKYRYKRQKISKDNLLNIVSNIKNEDYESNNTWLEDNYKNFNYSLDEIYSYIQKMTITEEVISKQGQNLKSLNSGIVSTNIDGYEDIYNFYNLNNFSNDIFISDEIIDNNSHKKGLKIINNTHYLLSFTVENEKLSHHYDMDSPIKIKFNDTYINGKVVGIKIDDKNTHISILCEENFELFKDLRFVKLELINFSTKTYEIPKKSIINKDDQDGVFVKEASGIIKFYPIEKLKEKDKSVLIYAGIDGKIKVNDKEVKTISAFSDVILNPSAVKEGDLIN